MRVKPDDLGLCHRDGCGNDAKWECEWVLRDTPIRALTTVKVCDQHKNDAADFILSDGNRNRFVNTIIDNNWLGSDDYRISYMCVKLNSLIEFLPLEQEAADER